MNDRTKTARRNLDRATTAAMDNASDLDVKLVDMARENTQAALEASTQIAKAKSPADLAEALSTHATKQFSMMTNQARELTEAWQRFFIPPR